MGGIDGEAWKEITWVHPKNLLRYEVSSLGRIRSVRDSGKTMIVKPVNRAKLRHQTVKLRDGDCSIYLSVNRVVWNAFNGEPPDGYVIAHKNGLYTDNSISNLYLTTRKHVLIKVIRKSCRPCVKIDKSGEILAYYESIRDAAYANYFSKAAISRRCRHALLDEFNEVQYTFRFLEEVEK